MKLSLNWHTYTVFHDFNPQISNGAFRLRKASLVPQNLAVFGKFRLLTSAATLRIAQVDRFVTLRTWRSIHLVIFLADSKLLVN